MAHSGESGKGNQRRFHGGGAKSISGRAYTEVLAKGLGIQETGGGQTERVWSLAEGDVWERRVSWRQFQDSNLRHWWMDGGVCVRCLPMKLLQLPEMYVYVCQSCLTLQDPMDCSLPGSSAHGDFPGKNRPFLPPGDLPHTGTELESWVSCIGRWSRYHWATWEEALLKDMTVSPCSTTWIEVGRRPDG